MLDLSCQLMVRHACAQDVFIVTIQKRLLNGVVGTHFLSLIALMHERIFINQSHTSSFIQIQVIINVTSIRTNTHNRYAEYQYQIGIDIHIWTHLSYLFVRETRAFNRMRVILIAQRKSILFIYMLAV